MVMSDETLVRCAEGETETGIADTHPALRDRPGDDEVEAADRVLEGAPAPGPERKGECLILVTNRLQHRRRKRVEGVEGKEILARWHPPLDRSPHRRS